MQRYPFLVRLIERTRCDCNKCKEYCTVMPGFLVPEDLANLCRHTGFENSPEEFAEKFLAASPGALVMYNGEPFRIRTLVPKTKPDGDCIFFHDDKCVVHEVSPFGCSMFGARPPWVAFAEDFLSQCALMHLHVVWHAPFLKMHELYTHLWNRLDAMGCNAIDPALLKFKRTERLQAKDEDVLIPIVIH